MRSCAPDPDSTLVSPPAAEAVRSASLREDHPPRALRRTQRQPAPAKCHHRILIGASTGGTRVLPEILGQLPPLRAGILVVQHMPQFINASYARTLSRHWAGKVRVAEPGDTFEDGLLLLAPSEVHCRLDSVGRIHLEAGPKVNFVCPAIDVAWKSIRAPLRPPLTAVLLTGMGRDGADGLLYLRHLGATTIAQDAASCAVYGMPAEAMKLGAAALQCTPSEIVQFLARLAQP